MSFVDPDGFVDPDQSITGDWSEAYKKYTQEAQQRASRPSIPGAEAYDRAPIKSFKDFSAEKDQEYKDKLIGVPEAGLSFLTGIPAALAGTAAGLTAPLRGKDMQKSFEETAADFTYEPRTDAGKGYVQSLGNILQALPPVGAYVSRPSMPKVKKVSPSTTLADIAKSKMEAAKFVDPDAVKEKVYTPSELKAWKETQDRFAAYKLEQEQAAKATEAQTAAQRAVEARQAALEQEVAQKAGLDLNAAERARQEQAPTGYAEWVEQQRQQAEQRLPGNNTPLEFQQPYPVDANAYPDVMQDAPYQYEGGIDYTPELANQKALPITVADTLRTGDKSVDPFARSDTARTTARNILENDLHPPVVKTSRRGGKQSGALDFKAITDAIKAKQDLLEQATAGKLYSPTPDANTTIAQALAHGKDARGADNFSAGGSLEGAKRNAPLVTGGVRILQSFKNRAEDGIRTEVFPVEQALRSLNKKELVELNDTFKQEMFMRQKFSMEELASAGLTEKQLIAYQKTRDMFAKALEEQNKIRAMQNLKPITEVEAYLSSNWQGDFRVPFHDANGKIVWYLAADNKISLNRQANALLAKFPGELTPGTMTIVRSSKRGVNANDIYKQMLDVLGEDDPAVAKIKQWVESSVVEEGRKALGQEKHFEPKGNVRGFIGDRPGRSPKSEAIHMFQQQINYSKNSYNWSAMQHAGQELKKIFSNEELALQQPENMKYLREYYADNLGFNEHYAIKALEDTIRDMGMSPNQLGRGIGNVKNLWVTQKLAASMGFMASNVLQAGNMLPHLMDLTVKQGGNPIVGLSLGIPSGIAMAMGHMAKRGGAFYKALGTMPGYDVFLARAMKYAEDNSVVARSIYDESPIASSFSAYGKASKIASKTITAPETLLRSIVYMTYVNTLKGSKKFASDLELFRMAEEKTNISMGDYREGERAMFFNKMGNMGNALNTLQTFPMNYYNQWIWAGREAGRGNVLPFATMLGVQAYAAGAMGVPGFAELDKLWEATKDWLSEKDPLMWKKVKNFSLKRALLETPLGEAGLYGGASVQSGVALTSRAAAPIPSEMVATPGAPAKDLLFDQLPSVVKAIADPMDQQKSAQALLNIAPTGLQGALETGWLKDQTSVMDPEGNRVYGKPKDLAERKGMVRRTPEEEKLRAYGLRSQGEVVRKDQTYLAEKDAVVASKVVSKLPGKIYNSLRKNDMEEAGDYIKLYSELSGKGFSRQQLETQIMEEFTTPDQRLKMRKNMPLETILAIKRLNALLDKLESTQNAN